MTTLQAARKMRAELDATTPGWRTVIRRMLDTGRSERVAWTTVVERPDGTAVRAAVLANPERVPDPAEIDPATDPFAGWQ